MVHIDRRTQRFQDVDFNVNVRQMEEMIGATARHGDDRRVRELAKHIRDVGIRRVTGAHAGGFGGAGREADPLQHCTLEDADRDRYHVYLSRRNGRYMIVNITA